MIRHILCASALLLLLASVTNARDITLEWDPNTEPDIAGYKIYYKADSPELPLDGTGAAEGTSPVDVGKNTRATLKGLDGSKIYYFSVTAYNSAGYESSFSNIVASDWVPVQTFPENEATTSGNVEFAWTSAPSDLPVNYTLYYGTDPALSAATIPPVAPRGPSLPPPPSYLASVLAAALTVSLFLARRRRMARSTAASLLCVLLVASCGGGGGGSAGSVTDNGTTNGGTGGGDAGTGAFTRAVPTERATTQSVSDLKPGVYYWKVVANDGQKLRTSTVYRFTVQ